MDDIDGLYKLINQDVYKEMWMNNIYTSTSLMRVAKEINTFKAAMLQQSTSQDQNTFFEANINKLKTNLKGIYESYSMYADLRIFAKMLADAHAFQGNNQIETIQKLKFQDNNLASAYAGELITESKLNNSAAVFNDILSNRTNLLAYSDNLMKFQSSLEQDIQQFAVEQKRRDGVLNKLMGDYVAVKELYQSKNFIPDANSTLRLTFGNIKGYSPVDATYMKPFTTLAGIIQKGNLGEADFEYPAEIKTAWENKNFGPYVKKELNDVPVNMLYNMDTTGGNSGSPIMNAYGELIGVNFDRSYDATINDFAWNDSYSRSIGVDIRYVLWVADKIDNAQFILKEMGI